MKFVVFGTGCTGVQTALELEAGVHAALVTLPPSFIQS